jgi:colicin import membrane protein
MNIGTEMKLLSEIKDVQNEPHMISTLLKQQSTCLSKLDKAIEEELELQEKALKAVKRREKLEREEIKRKEKLKREQRKRREERRIEEHRTEKFKPKDEYEEENLKAKEDLKQNGDPKVNGKRKMNEGRRFENCESIRPEEEPEKMIDRRLNTLKDEKLKLHAAFDEQMKGVEAHLDYVRRMDTEAKELSQSVSHLMSLPHYRKADTLT